jgi:hypothetical protein
MTISLQDSQKLTQQIPFSVKGIDGFGNRDLGHHFQPGSSVERETSSSSLKTMKMILVMQVECLAKSHSLTRLVVVLVLMIQSLQMKMLIEERKRQEKKEDVDGDFQEMMEKMSQKENSQEFGKNLNLPLVDDEVSS